ncbi:MAG: peptidylprolyl isomerase [Balneola sp.]|nr:peptidylprolyl isomerase [Balneola sp.]MBO6649570.1 peptidylprolyl isomerase [Balneola sp.]MBO6711387.1 peptidylprolyl isomerase [Balneola sp.]MBO6801259.1 peptidylprolyl isomerase [Balneola sp.]MBO6869323.1 peptidylprolyl isomerase [Balneola sp.]
MYKIISVLLLTSLLLACDPVKKETARLLTQEYPELYEAVYARDGQALMEFTSHKDERVRVQAWQALINTRVDSIDQLIDLVSESDTKEAWSSLWLKELSEEQQERLNELFIASNASNIGLVSALGELGNSRSLELLLEEDVPPNQEMEFQLAYSIGRLTGNVEATEEQQIQIIERALSTTNSKASQAYLYGFYRTRNNPDKQKLTSAAVKRLVELWRNFYPVETGPDRYIAALLMKDHSGLVFHHFIDKDYVLMDVQLAIEIIQEIGRKEENDTYAPVALNAFVQHKNPNVVIQALRVIGAKEEFAKKINNSLLNATALNVGVEPHVRLAGFNASVNPGKYIDDLLPIGTEDPYLQGLRYSALKKIWTEAEVFDYLVADIDTSQGLLYSFLLREMNTLWANSDEELKTEERVEQVHNILFAALKRGERAFTMQALFSDENVVTEEDFEKLIALLNDKSVVDDIDIFRSVTSILKSRFEEESEVMITQFYENAGHDLKQSLIAQEWTFIDDSLAPVSFRIPDWDRLADLGPNPVWVLETRKGDIEITVDVLTAPATISGMDSLITNGHYNGVAFHRVVPNFVIQGGDVETGSGFGGPDYTVPTEASSAHYFRGKAGIASSGPDTEGSQYFFMHVWAPHLNGRYTIFGVVTDGMSVVDRITQGDVVQRSYWK